MALLLGALVEPSYNKGMYAYIGDFKYDAADIVTDLASITFIKDHLSELPEGFTSVTYASNRRTVSHDMKTGGTWGVTVLPDEQDSYTLKVEKGKADVTAYYHVGPEGLSSAKKDPNMSLSRRYTNVTGNGEFMPGDIVRVEVEFNMSLSGNPRGGYVLTDILPAGLAYIPNPTLYGYTVNDWAYEREKNVIVYRAYNDSEWFRYNDNTLVYYARVAGSGTYVAEPAVFQFEEKPSIMTFTDRDTIQVRTENIQ